MTPYLDGRTIVARPGSRFLIFGLAAILALGGLATRLFYLQVVQGGQFAALSQGNREVQQAIPSSRGLIYDRQGARPRQERLRPTAVKVRPVDLPEQRRDEVVARLSALLSMPTSRHQRRDRRQSRAPGSTSFGSPTDVPDATARLMPRPATPCPASRSSSRPAASTRRDRSSRRSSATPARSRRTSSSSSRSRATCPMTCRQDRRSRRTTRTSCAGRTAARPSSATPPAASSRSSRPRAMRRPATRSTLTIDVKEQIYAQQALQWGMRAAGLKRGVVIVDEPADRRGPRDGQPADLRRQRLRPRDQRQGLREARSTTRTSRC